MRKWCPEPFEMNRDEPGAAEGHQAPFVQESPVGMAAPANEASGFEKDHFLSDRQSLWDLMNEAEKDQLLEKSRQLLEADFEARESELIRHHQAELSEIHSEFERRLDTWSREMTSALQREKEVLAKEAAALSLVLAGKIIRDTAKVDPDFLSRTLETVLFKIQDNRPLTAVLHPDDAALLTENPDLMKRLRIDTVIPDRRVETGGCRLRCGGKEWDATLAGQMDVLADVVEETLASAGGLQLSHSKGENDSCLD
jgi:flagellar biosynthesis/type III secretory pathway protein FliH